MAIKRAREREEADSLATAQYLMLLSNSLDNYKPTKHLMMTMKSTGVFECKTCGRKFPSFQALGGHRASHKRAKIMGDKPYDRDDDKFLSLATKPKMHECSICGQEFSMGQALGGHMRRHKLEMTEKSFVGTVPLDLPKLPVLRRSNSSRRVFGLDLNLTPLENDLEYLFGNKAPKVGNFI